jgi:hypothetical protein
LARVAPAFREAPCWLIAVPAPFTAFSAFTQFVTRLTQLSAPAKNEGFIVAIALDGQGAPATPDDGWSRYWRDTLRAEAVDCAILNFTP